MLLSFRQVHLDKLCSFWNETLPPKYAIDDEIFRLNTVDCPTFDWGASAAAVDDDMMLQGFVIVKHSSARLYPGPDPDRSHLSAIVFHDKRLAVDLLHHSKSILRSRGVQELVFGQDTHHFFPGCPFDLPKLQNFLEIEGFIGQNEVYDMVADVSTYKMPAGVKALPAEGSPCVRPLDLHETGALSRFLSATFPGRWHHDTMSKVSKESSPAFVQGLFVDGTLKGFAVLQFDGLDHPQCGAVWRKGLGQDWATLGPIGICPTERKKGLGDALLATSIDSLRQKGKKHCLIDWTVLVDWYGKHGFEVGNTYRSMTLSLPYD